MRWSCSAASLLPAILLLVMAAPASAQRHYALVIGVEDYNPDQLRALKYAEDDALAMAERLRSLGYHVMLMTGQASNPRFKPSTPEKILTALDGRLKGVEQDDVVVIALTGHGVQFSDESRLAGGSRETYFCPEDAVLADKSTLLPVTKQVLSRIERCQAERKLVLIDACRNQVAPHAGDLAARRIKIDAVHEHPRTVPTGMSVIYSCSETEQAYEHDELGHSVFSKFVIDYFDGKAAGDLYDRRAPTIDGLVAFVRLKTNRFVLDQINSRGQLPTLVGNRASWRIAPAAKAGSVSLYPPGQKLSANEIAARRRKALRELDQLGSRDETAYIRGKLFGPDALEFKLEDWETDQLTFIMELASLDPTKQARLYREKADQLLGASPFELGDLDPFRLALQPPDPLNALACFRSGDLFYHTTTMIRPLMALTTNHQRIQLLGPRMAAADDTDRVILASLCGDYRTARIAESVGTHLPYAVVAPLLAGRIDEALAIAASMKPGQGNIRFYYQQGALLLICDTLLDEGKTTRANEIFVRIDHRVPPGMGLGGFPVPQTDFTSHASHPANYALSAHVAGRLDDEQAFAKIVDAGVAFFHRNDQLELGEQGADRGPPPPTPDESAHADRREYTQQLRRAFIRGLVRDL